MRVNFVRKVRCSLGSLVGAVLLASFAIGADAPEQDAINHLLKFVETSRCTFLRNGVEYDSKSAVNHIKEKYDYFKSQIYTAEDFIALAATKSELSGGPYFHKRQESGLIAEVKGTDDTNMIHIWRPKTCVRISGVMSYP